MAKIRRDIKRTHAGEYTTDPKAEGEAVAVMRITGKRDAQAANAMGLVINEITVILPGKGGAQVIKGVIGDNETITPALVDEVNAKAKKLVFPQNGQVFKSDS